MNANCECGSMDRLEEDHVHVDLTTLPGPDTVRSDSGEDFVLLE